MHCKETILQNDVDRELTILSSMVRHNLLYSIGYILCILSLLAILHNVNVSSPNRIVQQLNNFGHVPLFGILALLVLALTNKIVPQKSFRFKYSVTFTAIVCLGIFTEVAQIPGSRDADVWDVIRDMVGGASFLAYGATFDHRIRWFHSDGERVRKNVRIGAISAVCLSAMPILFPIIANFDRHMRFPEIVNFDSIFQWEDVRVHKATSMERVEPPETFTRGNGKVARVTFGTNFPYPGVGIISRKDWSEYLALEMDVFSELDSATEIIIRIHDKKHNGKYSDRFSRRFRITPGAHHLCIPAHEIRTAPKNRVMEMDAIEGIIIFTVKPDTPFSLMFDSIRLSKMYTEDCPRKRDSSEEMKKLHVVSLFPAYRAPQILSDRRFFISSMPKN